MVGTIITIINREYHPLANFVMLNSHKEMWFYNCNYESDRGVTRGFTEFQLEPIPPEEKGSWEDCVWKPNQIITEKKSQLPVESCVE